MRMMAGLVYIIVAILFAPQAFADNWKDCSSKNFTRSIRGCSAIIKSGRESKKDLALVYDLRGMTYYAGGDYDRAIADHSKSLSLIPKSPETYNLRGMAYDGKGEHDRAIADYDKAIALNPKYANAFADRGLSYYEKGDYKKAIADLDKALQLDPKNENAFINRGNAFRDSGEYDRAIIDFDKAIKLKPSDDVAYNNRGLTQFYKGDFDRAIVDLDQAISLNPKSLNSYTNRGWTHYRKSNYDQSISDFDKAISIDSKNAVAYQGRGSAYGSKSEYEKAFANLDMAIVLNPKLTEAYNDRGFLYFLIGNYSSAITDFDEAIRLNPKYAFAYGNRGYTQLMSNNFDRAISDLDEAISLDPKYVAAYNNRGLAHVKTGNYKQALTDLNKAIEIDPKISNPHKHLGFVYYNMGDFDRAIAKYDTAISLNPEYGSAYFSRGEAYYKKGQVERALADFRQAIANLIDTDPESRNARLLIAEIEAKLAASTTLNTNSGLQTTPSQANVQVDKRVALVIGNSAYEYSPQLRNPRNDADAISRMLSTMGFQVITGLDLKKAELEDKVREFATATKSADLSLFFYAGHGLQVAGQNYLVPIDAKVDDDTALNFELVNAAVVTNYMGGEKKVGIVLLDACRDNPFTRTLKRSLGATRAASVSQGLAAISSEGGGLVIGYATAPGDVAADGDGINSPFTTALLKRLPTKGTELELVLKRVKADVIEATQNRQRPWTNSDLSTEVYLQPSN